MADNGQRTEQPTQRRMDRARKEGQFPSSKELVSAAQFAGFVAMVAAFGAAWFHRIVTVTQNLLVQAFRIHLTAVTLSTLGRDIAERIFLPLILCGIGLIGIIFFAQLSTTRFGFAGSKLAPDLKRLNPFSKIQSLPGQNLHAFLQAFALLPLVGASVYYLLSEHLGEFLTLPWMTAPQAFSKVAGTLQQLLWRVTGLFLMIGVADLFWQRRRYTRQLRMTKQEVREEAKEQQGNPQIKMRIRRLQRDLLRRQMMKEVPKATAVIVNPTHFAVAIRYSLEDGSAPKVIAKGKNYLALRIRQRAIEHQVPIVENPPLAQALYKSVEVGQEIPANLYRAVAEILAYIYRLMNGRLPGA